MLPITIFIFALAVRLFVLSQLANVDPLPPISDMSTYYAQALALKTGEFPPNAPFYYHPLMPYLISFSFEIFGTSTLSPRILNCIIGSLACAVLSLGVAKLTNYRTGIIAGILYALYQGAVYQSTVILDTSFTALSLATILYFIATPSFFTAILSSLLLSLGILGKGNLLVITLSVLLYLLYKKNYKLCAIFFVGTLIVIGPIVLRNGVHGEYGIATNGPTNLWIGNNHLADGSHQNPPYNFDNSLALSKVTSFIYNQPGDWILLQIRKLTKFIFLPDTHFTEQGTIRTDGLPFSWLLRILPSYLLYFTAGIIALVTVKLPRSIYTPLLLVFLPYSLSIIVFFIESRFRVPVVMLLSALTAIWINKELKRITDR